MKGSFLKYDLRRVANQLYYPSYLSFESALSYYGVLSQVPYTQTFATVKKSKKMVLGGTEVEFTQLKNRLFFGYEIREGFNIARAEKALLDQAYLTARGKRRLSYDGLDLSSINPDRLKKYAQKFPPYALEKLKEYKIL